MNQTRGGAWFLAGLCCLAATAALAQSARSTTSRASLESRIDSLVTSYLASGPIAGAAVAVVRGTDTVAMRGYGLADMAAKRRAGPTTIYEIGSLTK